MSTHSMTDSPALDLDSTTAGSATKRNWWNPFTRFTRNELPRFGTSRRMMEEIREEQRRLVETLEKLNDRIDTDSSSTAMPVDPMPVMRGIESIHAGQKQLTDSIVGLNRHMERSRETEERLSEAVTSVDKSLSGVRASQTDTTQAVNRVGDRIETIASRFESLFTQMQDAETQMAAEYRKLQSRSLVAIGGIALSVIVVLTIFMVVAPWA